MSLGTLAGLGSYYANMDKDIDEAEKLDAEIRKKKTPVRQLRTEARDLYEMVCVRIGEGDSFSHNWQNRKVPQFTINLATRHADDVIAAVTQMFEEQGWQCRHCHNFADPDFDLLEITAPENCFSQLLRRNATRWLLSFQMLGRHPRTKSKKMKKRKANVA